MPRVEFTPILRRHLPTPTAEVEGDTVRAVLDAVFAEHPALRGYILDDQGAVRLHVAIFVDGEPLIDRESLSDAVGPRGEVFVMQALSGG